MVGFTREINQYITEIDKIYRHGNATERSSRHALKAFFNALIRASGLTVSNAPKRIACGAAHYTPP